MEVNDTLKLKAYGWKKDMQTNQAGWGGPIWEGVLQTKIPHITKVIEN